MTTYRFPDVGYVLAKKSVPCASGCGKKVRRQRTFTQTLNPFNKNAAGAVKTVPEIRAENKECAEEWKAKPETCSACEEARLATGGNS
jgi:hypothetical protein